MTVLVIDNYDSFVWNLARMVREAGRDVRVVRADAIGLAEIRDAAPMMCLISPGPERPDDAGISVPLVAEFGARLPILGVCLGHQAIGEALGAAIVETPPVHGKPWAIHHAGAGLFGGLPSPLTMTRYHSLAVARDSLPSTLRVDAWAEDGTVMALTHRRWPVAGVQFHPESIASEQGAAILAAMLTASERFQRDGQWLLGDDDAEA